MQEISYIMPEILIILSSLVSSLLCSFKVKFHQSLVRLLAISSVAMAMILLINAKVYNNIFIFREMLLRDHYSIIAKIAILICSFLILILHNSLSKKSEILNKPEFSIIILLSIVGLMAALSANNLLILYMGLELSSLAIYGLVSFDRDNINSSEAGLKYFILGSIASGILLYGISLIYGFTGTISYPGLIRFFADNSNIPLAVIVGIVMVLIGLLFKISAAPFHIWAPDVYQGSPSLVTLFISTVPKIAIIAIFARLLSKIFVPETVDLRQIIIFSAILSLIIGSIGAINQKNIKRILAYSSINNMGFALIGLSSNSIYSIYASSNYIFLYAIMNIGIFAIILSVSNPENPCENIDDLSSMSKFNQEKSIYFLISMLSISSIPPLAGFLGKFTILISAFNYKLYYLIGAAIFSTVISSYYYLRFIKVIFLGPKNRENFGDFPRGLRLVTLFTILFVMFFFLISKLIIEPICLSSINLFMETM